MAQSTFWTTPKKIAFTIILAVAVWYMFGCANHPHDIYVDIPAPTTSNHDTDAAYLQHLYETYNEQYFGSHLTLTPKITVVDETNTYMADTECKGDDGTDCTLTFNLHYVAAPRTAQSTLLHEMCHIKVWNKHLVKGAFPPDPGSEFYHDRSWRACMLGVDAAGAFRQINIDFYHEDIH
jgi:SprT-like family